MGIFNKKITLYVNTQRLGIDDIASGVAVLADGLVGDEWHIEMERGSYERFCNCGAEDCKNEKPVESAQ